MKRGFWWSVALAVAVHGAWLLAAAWTDRTAGGAEPRPASSRVLSVRTVEAPTPVPAPEQAGMAEASLPESPADRVAGEPSPRPAPDATLGTATEAPAEPASPAEFDASPLSESASEDNRMPLDPPPAPGLAREKAADPSISPPAAALNPAGAASVSASSGASPAGSQPADDAFDETPYLRRGQLTRGPAPRDAVVLTYPMFEEDEQGRYTAVLALFIDETGRVQRIRVEPPGLPAPLEGAARRAFLAARFTPGEVDGRPVRSLIRIEVQFDRGDTTPE